MIQKGNQVTLLVMGEKGEYETRTFTTQHEAKQFHREVYDENGNIIWNPRAVTFSETKRI